MIFEQFVRRAALRRLVSTAEGRAHVLSLMVAAEEGDEAGVFDRLIGVVDDPKLQATIRRHRDDEMRHARMYRSCLDRNGLREETVPDELMIIRQVGREAGGPFAQGADSRSAEGICSREDVMNTYALLLAIEERGVEQFPIIGAEFRRLGDHETADTFDRVAKDELRHTKYCRAIGRRYARDEAGWNAAVERYRRIERRAFARVGLAGLAHALRRGLLWKGPFGRLGVRLGAMIGGGTTADHDGRAQPV